MSSPFHAEVVAVNRISPHFTRVSLGGAAMTDFAPVGYDQWFRLFLPRDGEDKPGLPDFTDDNGLRTWYNATPENQRPIIRNYTVRHFDPEARILDVDFVIHGDTGPASAWAQQVRIGDVVGIYDQGAMFTPHPDSRWFCFVGDETALPAIAASLDTLGRDLPDLPCHTFVELPSAADRQPLRLAAGSTLRWRFRREHEDAPTLPELVAAAMLPDDPGQVLIAGESSMVRAVRRHFVNDRGFAKNRIEFCGYWRSDPADTDDG